MNKFFRKIFCCEEKVPPIIEEKIEENISEKEKRRWFNNYFNMFERYAESDDKDAEEILWDLYKRIVIRNPDLPSYISLDDCFNFYDIKILEANKKKEIRRNLLRFC